MLAKVSGKSSLRIWVRSEGREEACHVAPEGRTVQGEGTVRAEALRWECPAGHMAGAEQAREGKMAGDKVREATEAGSAGP